MAAVTTPFAHEVIGEQINSVLTTQLDMNRFAHVDSSLQENAGMKKTIHVYKSTGSVADVNQGAGNSTSIAPQYESATYTVKVTQGRFEYYDEQQFTDPTFVDAGVKGLAEAMTNDLTAKIVNALDGASQKIGSCTWTFANVVDAIAAYPYEDENNLFLLINPAIKAAFRKNLGDDLKYSEGFARTGYIGSVCGVPVFVSKAVPADTAYLATAEAVTVFVKKGLETEVARDANTRKNSLYARKCMVVALTDATRAVKLQKAAISG